MTENDNPQHSLTVLDGFAEVASVVESAKNVRPMAVAPVAHGHLRIGREDNGYLHTQRSVWDVGSGMFSPSIPEEYLRASE